ncbi:DUF4268 domain-containing protein [Altererythrobacter sp.]|uniref:DUF4268 domain-containing protein n=1 Tax=Altererythrobacter sp. TaxID=1872480 RepID=UPI001B136F62|nr:DUF4268 domain-containing protein [Altererythrobacter sp.]MBO6609344.1 DUF4268 domain-containing protein [Altererythrobacter sp.]MBO6640655.1 DUF4268 domain-containing protein [Altererythrobacter sp.]MBO6696985.1 DUF4268 domain-containing protein [Henriciella sp.]MBO6708647.1 DUF4268 domain-containing protein [Altererythrobacter sp.]
MTDLGRLVRVDLRTEWGSEPRDFTPWLAREENIALLGETLNMSLEVEQEEQAVGRFSADILCKDTGSADAGWVVIENQLETTDHSHLGQILTYAAGLEAKTCIWVAAKFHEEHRAAIDWLNEISGDDHQFFGLEIELWRIGESVSAPKFNVVAKPNDWKRDVGRSARSMAPAKLTETKRLQLEFWEALRERLSGHRSLKPQKPRPQHWTTLSIGRSGMHLGAIINTREDNIGVELYLADESANAYFEQLEQDREIIDAEVDFELVWMPLPERRACRIIGYHPLADLADKTSWPELQAWMISALEQMHTTFGSRVRNLSSEISL